MYQILKTRFLILMPLKILRLSMKKTAILNLIGLLLIVLFSSCAKKAEDYAYLVDSYRKICCKTLSSNTIPLDVRKRAMRKKIKLEQDFKEALRHLKQNGKEKLTKQWSEVIVDAENGKCKY